MYKLNDCQTHLLLLSTEMHCFDVAIQQQQQKDAITNQFNLHRVLITVKYLLELDFPVDGAILHRESPILILITQQL